MPVDVTTETTIARALEDVWSYAVDPMSAPQWYANIDRVEMVTSGPIVLGSQMRFHARFLGRALAYTYEVRELEEGRVFTMSTSEGPFPMTTTYRFESIGDGRTRMTLRNHGQPRGFGAIAAPVMAAAMRRANQGDLARIRSLLEGS